MPKKLRKISRWRVWLVVVAGLMLVVFGAAIAVRLAIAGIRASRYLPTPGIVLNSRIEGKPTARGAKLYKPIIVYSYAIKNIRYENNVYDPFDDEMSEGGATGVLEQYPPGAGCRVYYDPANPSTSALTTSPNISWIAIAAMSSFLGLAHAFRGIFALWLMRTKLDESVSIKPGLDELS